MNGDGSYCPRSQVLSRLYSGQSSTTAMTVDAGRDALVDEIIAALSREFDKETGRIIGNYDLSYEARYFSGQGEQELDVDEFAFLSKVEYNTTIFGTPTWNDVTSEIASGRIAMRPIRYWPKRQLFRLNTWIVDPYKTGNTRLTGIWGRVQPVKGAIQPVAPWSLAPALTQGQIQALAPDPTLTTGWWATPLDVSKAVAAWSAYEFKAGQAGYSDSAGKQGTGVLFTKGIPPQVQRVIDKFKGAKLKLALIGLDGSDASDDSAEGGGLTESTRWSGWQSYNPATGQSN